MALELGSAGFWAVAMSTPLLDSSGEVGNSSLWVQAPLAVLPIEALTGGAYCIPLFGPGMLFKTWGKHLVAICTTRQIPGLLQQTDLAGHS